MYSLRVEGSFSSAHNLRGYKGKCEDLHGHNWRVEMCVKSLDLDNIGMLLDFKFLKKKLSVVLEKMDHKYLNKLIYFKRINPTSENIAKYIYNQLKNGIPALKSITVWENSTSCATYEE
ncbi:MAG: 6-carboxytetrahydropterin synthase QueD [Candidatus Omnitrophica bacterium]|jgi:6-pyruvoyltetrahydropterin/6-carboxytetrahydropterin synthase|nr:6-carboxytetrahydropterin synthase QueD [Candidatus Omnitrophota bacterium]MDD5253059.1 6-carboxytetrahydropterin synthase QueD [Candidatus Omnitrophota bacterium]